MKLKENILLRQVADTWVVMPVAEAVLSLNAMLTLNESGALLWKTLEAGCTREELVAAFTGEYIVSRQQAEADVDEFLAKVRELGCLEE